MLINNEIKFVDKDDKIESSSKGLLGEFYSDRIITAVFEEIQLNKKCIDLLYMMNNTEPERESKGIQTWFKHEESIYA